MEQGLPCVGVRVGGGAGDGETAVGRAPKEQRGAWFQIIGC